MGFCGREKLLMGNQWEVNSHGEFENRFCFALITFAFPMPTIFDLLIWFLKIKSIVAISLFSTMGLFPSLSIFSEIYGTSKSSGI